MAMFRKPRKVEFPPGERLDDCVKMLQYYRYNNDSVYTEFNGHKLYSDSVRLDGAYKEVLGLTKAEHTQKLEEMAKERQEQEEKKAQKTTSLIDRGNEVIDPQKSERWKELVAESVDSIYEGDEIEDAIELMQMMKDQKPAKDIIKKFKEQNHTGASAALERRILTEFLPKDTKQTRTFQDVLQGMSPLGEKPKSVEEVLSRINSEHPKTEADKENTEIDHKTR